MTAFLDERTEYVFEWRGLDEHYIIVFNIKRAYEQFSNCHWFGCVS